MTKEQSAKRKAEWLVYCLRTGWPKSTLDELSKIWDKFKDENGNFRISPPASANQSEMEYETADKLEYWKKRCEAAEEVIGLNYRNIPDSPTYQNWQNTIEP